MTAPVTFPQLVREFDRAFAPLPPKDDTPFPTDEDAPPDQVVLPITAAELARMLDDDIGAALRKDVFSQIMRVRANPEEWFRIGEVLRHKKIKREFNEAVKTHDRRARQTQYSDWRQQFITRNTKDGDTIIENVLSNIVLILTHDEAWQGVFSYDEFCEKLVVKRDPPFDRRAGQWSDVDDLETKAWIEQHYPLKPKTDLVCEAVRIVSARNRFNAVTDYLKNLKPTGENTIDNWLTLCFGAPDTQYTRAIGRMWLVSAVARAFEPGCKVDTVLILEGNQGFKKSRVLEQLCPNPSWFTDGLSDFGSKDQAAEIQGKWIVELGELKGFRKDLERTKAFVTRRRENYRPAYGKHVIEQPRKCVFAGTVNPSNDGYLLDETGNRRFWPIECSQRAPEITKEFRDNLWAQAVALWLSGEEWWVEDQELSKLVVKEQEKRVQVDPWHNVVAEKLVGKEDTCVDEIFDFLRIDTGKWTHHDSIRIGRILKMMGWHKYRTSVGSRGYRYKRPLFEESAMAA